MTKQAALPNHSPSPLSVQTIVIAAIAWAVFALLFFLLFSVSTPGAGRPDWYTMMTYLLELVAFSGAGLLCLRNWRSSQIVSGRGVWLSIGTAMFCYAIGNMILAWWEVVWGKDPAISPGDLFFILNYVLLGWGMLQAVLARKVTLTAIQWGIVGLIAAAGIGVATIFAPTQPANAALAPVAPLAQAANPQASPKVPPQASPKASPAAAPSLTPYKERETEKSSKAPQWAIALEDSLAPFGGIVNWLYVLGDVVLVILASILLLAFWGGKYSLSWRFIASSSFSFYIADIWFNYANTYIEDYQSGELPEVFWVFSGCLMAIGAALEFDLSTRRRNARRRA